MAKIIVTHGVPAERFALLQPHEVVIPAQGKAFTEDELVALLPDCDAALACGDFSRRCVEAAKRLRLIVCYGAGYDRIDVRAATERGIFVANTPDSVTEATAELAIGLMLDAVRRIRELDALLRAGEPAFGMGKRMGVLLEGATLGVVGMGRIGSRVAELARCFRMHILYCGHSPKPCTDARFVPLEALLAQSDIVSLHCPCTPETEGLLSRERIALMKPTAILINTARGRIVDEAALAEALRNHRIAAAGLDVFADEPHINPALLALPNVVLTPHVGSNTLQTRNRMAEDACERILDVLAGRRPANLLNPDARA